MSGNDKCRVEKKVEQSKGIDTGGREKLFEVV